MTCLLVSAIIAAAEGLPAPTRESFNCSADGSRWPYLVQLPEGDPTALLVYLHGHYSDETQGMTVGIYNDAFGKLRRECLRRRWVYATAYYGGNTWMGPMGEQGLADLIALLRQRWPKRPLYLCGGSMGGSSALVFAVRRPDLLDGVIALCPAGDIRAYYAFASASKDPTLSNIAAAIRIHYRADGHALEDELAARSALLNAERMRFPVYLCHGAKDTLIPVEGVRALAARLKEHNRPVRYVEQPEGAHDTPVTEINWPEALDFMSAGRTQP